MDSGRVFLSAEWRNLVMLNYRVEPAILAPYVPRGTTVDSFSGHTYVSVVAFQFLRTKIFGAVPVPFHVNFDEVNLRFYVRREEGAEIRRGVVFVKEIVPRRAIAYIARLSYGERYFSCPMRHAVASDAHTATAKYEWKHEGEWCSVEAAAKSAPKLPVEGSLEQFITEHYWGYSMKRGGGTLEYKVSHVPWRVWTAAEVRFQGNGDRLYGQGFGQVLSGKPDSAFIAEGSDIEVRTPRLLPAVTGL
ncbi:MAG TPA: DUF2071 domain-containing protein [Candidatus Acidoferrales bacterium]